MVTWDDPFILSVSSEDGVSHLTSFLRFIEGALTYDSYETDSIREGCRRLLLIDLLPTVLLQDATEADLSAYSLPFT